MSIPGTLNATRHVVPSGDRDSPHRRLAIRAVSAAHRAVAVLCAALLLSVALAAPTFAAASVEHFSFTSTDDPPIPVMDDCRGVAGTLVGTATVNGTQVTTAQGFHIEGSIAVKLVFSFVDGSTATGDETDHFSFDTGPGASTFTSTHFDEIAAYSADGQFLEYLSLRETEHFTVTSDGVVRAQVDVSRAGGGC